MSNEHDNQGAREGLVEQLAEALLGWQVGGSGYDWASVDDSTSRSMARAILPLVAAQVEAAVSVARAERAMGSIRDGIARGEADHDKEVADLRDALMLEEERRILADREAEAAESDLRALRGKVARVEALHLARGFEDGGTPNDWCHVCDERRPCTTIRALSDPTTPDQEGGAVMDHGFSPVRGHADDDECTHRSDGTDDTYCGKPEDEHEWSTR